MCVDELQQKQWSSDQEKEQFSPVSVLDCLFDDDDDEVSSPFQHRLARMEGITRNVELINICCVINIRV